MHAHPLDLRLVTGAANQPVHRHHLAIEEADDEVAAGVEVGRAYLVLPGAPAAVRAGVLWPEILERKGGSYSLLAEMPANPSLNLGGT